MSLKYLFLLVFLGSACDSGGVADGGGTDTRDTLDGGPTDGPAQAPDAQVGPDAQAPDAADPDAADPDAAVGETPGPRLLRAVVRLQGAGGERSVEGELGTRFEATGSGFSVRGRLR